MAIAALPETVTDREALAATYAHRDSGDVRTLN